ncbi:hypothetical protein CHS0354_037470 [Potamilus streckersoni]|uniref:Uncharacterized protein n=1 Tax=Potamilus streckersoni TaxID=2493646 RepID=A0AAE0RP94_9BIVA|nr:hypothetical protein CHS0354_037470 [Potamilus streckersoni]
MDSWISNIKTQKQSSLATLSVLLLLETDLTSDYRYKKSSSHPTVGQTEVYADLSSEAVPVPTACVQRANTGAIFVCAELYVFVGEKNRAAVWWLRSIRQLGGRRGTVSKALQSIDDQSCALLNIDLTHNRLKKKRGQTKANKAR